MKSIKLFSLLLVLVMCVFSLTACKDKNHNESGTDNATNKVDGFDEIELNDDIVDAEVFNRKVVIMKIRNILYYGGIR